MLLDQDLRLNRCGNEEREIMRRGALSTAGGLVVLKDGLLPWTTRKQQRNIQEKQSPALLGLKIIALVLTGEVLGSC